MISVGDLIEAIDDKSTVGVRHFQVARHLKDIPVGTTFNVTLMEPKKAFSKFIHICFLTNLIFLLLEGIGVQEN